MTHKHHREKHSKKRHFIGKDHIHAKGRMAALRPEEKLATSEKNEKAEQVNQMVEKQTVEPAKQTSEVKAVAADATYSTPPVMAQKIFQFEKKKNAFEKFKDKFHQIINHFEK